MDYEQRFIAGLLHAGTNDQQEIYLRQLPPDLFRLREKEWEWVTRWRKKYGTYPSAKAYYHHFEERLKKPKDSPQALLEVVLHRYFFERLKKNVSSIKDMIDSGATMENVVSRYRMDAEALRTISASQQLFPAESESVEEYYRERVRLLNEPTSIILESPWKSLNRMCNGLYLPQETFVLVGRTSMGKTWYLLWWAHFFASKGIKVLFSTHEMGVQILKLRLEAIRFNVPFESLKGGTLTPRELALLRRRRRGFQNSGKAYPIYFHDPNLDRGVTDDFASLDEQVRQIQPSVVIADSYYKARHPAIRGNMTQAHQMSILSAEMTRFAKRNNVLFIVSIQTGRVGEDKKGQTRPSLTGIHGSDAWGQDNDYVAEISGARRGNQRLVTLLKARNGAIGEFFTEFSINPPNFSERLSLSALGEEELVTSFEALK